MKIGLYGIYGVYNLGCEAIVRGASKLIHNLFPDAEIIYFSYNYEFDKNALKDIDIKVEPIMLKKTLGSKIINKIYTLTNRKKRIFYFDAMKIINSVDTIFSIGGDIYTIPEILREKKKYSYYNSLVDFCDRAVEAGKDVVVYGASVGPFGNYKKAVDYYKENLKRYKAIICREQVSIDYLNNIGLKNVYFFPDPAFQVKLENTNLVSPQYIGVNLSPLSVNEIYGNCGDENCRRLAGLLDSIYEETNTDLLFIPHVFSLEEGDNDFVFMKKLQKMMKSQNQHHVIFADSKKGFCGLKPELKKCYLVASARMHCAINAIDENIPAIFLSYSQKSIGMCEYVYGSRDWTVDLKELENEVVFKIKRMLCDREKIVNDLTKRNREIEEFYRNNLIDIARLFCMKG